MENMAAYTQVGIANKFLSLCDILHSKGAVKWWYLVP